MLSRWARYPVDRWRLAADTARLFASRFWEQPAEQVTALGMAASRSGWMVLGHSVQVIGVSMHTLPESSI